MRRFGNYIFVIFGTGATRVLSFTTAVLLARYLGPEGFGEVSVFLTVVGFWASGDFIDSTYVRYVARASAGNTGETSGTYLSAAFVLKSLWNGVILLLAAPLALLLSSVAFHKTVLFWALLAALLCGLGLNFLSLRAAVFQGQERFLPYATTSSAFYLLAFLAVIGAILVDRVTPSSVYVGYLISSGAVGIYAMFALHRARGGPAVIGKAVREFFQFSRWLFGANLGYMIAQRLDLFLLAGFGTLAAVGQYGAALRVVVGVSLFTGSLAPVLLPRASKAHGSSGRLLSYLRFSAYLSGAIVVLICSLWIAAPFVIHLLFGATYSSAAPLVRILLVATLCNTLSAPLSQLFFRDRQPRKLLLISVMRIIVTLAVAIPLIPALGSTGAAISVVCTETAVLLYVSLSLRSEITRALAKRRLEIAQSAGIRDESAPARLR